MIRGLIAYYAVALGLALQRMRVLHAEVGIFHTTGIKVRVFVLSVRPPLIAEHCHNELLTTESPPNESATMRRSRFILLL